MTRLRPDISISILTAILVLLSGATVTAEELSARPLTPELAIADTLALSLGVVTALAQPDGTSTQSRFGRGVAMAGGVGAIAAPSIYWANRRDGLGFGSLMLRTSAPLTGSIIGLATVCVAREGERGCVTDGVMAGTAVGVVSAAALDLALLSRLTRKRQVPDKRWYGWQILIVDASTAVLGAAVVLNVDGPLFTPNPDNGLLNFAVAQWIPMWLLGTIAAPVVHFANGQLLKGLGSGALRFFGSATAIVAGLTGYCAAVGGEEGCTGVGISWGLIGGTLLTATFDAFLIARKPVADSTEKNPVVLVPTVLDGVPGVGIAGRF